MPLNQFSININLNQLNLSINLSINHLNHNQLPQPTGMSTPSAHGFPASTA